MANFQDLPNFIMPIILENLDFEEFANAFKIWMHGKTFQDRVIVLQEVDICKFFRVGAWNLQYGMFIRYACNLGVDDALFYLPALQLARNGADKDLALDMLRLLGETGHARSRFTYNLFNLIYKKENQELAVQSIIETIQMSQKNRKIEKWVKELQYLNSGWDIEKFNYDTIPAVCVEADKGQSQHFNRFSWSRTVYSLDDIKCMRCKVALILFDFCSQNNWN